MRRLSSRKAGALVVISTLAAVYTLLSLFLQASRQQVPKDGLSCDQATRLGKCDRAHVLEPSRLQYMSSTPLFTAASLSCLSSDRSVDEPATDPFTLVSLVRDKAPQLEQVASYFSSRDAQLQATLIVSFTLDRIAEQLEPICENWPGPISAAVYLPLVTNEGAGRIESARSYLFDLHSRLEEKKACQADIFLMSEGLANASFVDLFPINALRNVALLAARTELVLIGDGDFLMSRSLVDELSSTAGFQRIHQLCEAGHYVVLPAFEVLLDKSIAEDRSSKQAQMDTARRRAQGVVCQSKIQLLQSFPKGASSWLAPFGFWRNFTNGHGPTDFPRWASATSAYEAKYAWQYEPWGLMERHQTPLFDERFRGYGYNKAVWSRWISALGHKFMVHPSAFMVHQPHEESCAKGLWRRSMPDGLPEKLHPKMVVSESSSCGSAPDAHLFMETQRQGYKVRAEIAEGIYKPVLSQMTRRCKATLPWC